MNATFNDRTQRFGALCQRKKKRRQISVCEEEERLFFPSFLPVYIWSVGNIVLKAVYVNWSSFSMISKALERRTTAPENVLPSYNRDYSILEDCLGYKPAVKMTRLHDSNNKSKLCDISWTCDGSRLVYSTRDCVQLMNPQAFIPEVSMPGMWYKAIPSSLNPLQLLCISIVEPCIDFYDLRSKGPSYQIMVPKESILNVAWSKDDKTVVTGDREDNLHAIDMRYFTGEKSSAYLMEPRSHRRTALTKREGGASKYWFKGISDKKELPYYVKSHARYLVEIHDMTFSSDGKHLIMARNDGNLEITYLQDSMDIFNKNEKELVKAHIYGSTIVKESSGMVASFGQDQTISLLDLSSKSIISTMGGVDGLVSSIGFNNTVDVISVATSQGKKHDDSNDTLVLTNMELKILSRFDIPGRIVASSWHPYRQILALACNPLGSNSANNTSSSNSGANTSSIHYNKIISSGLNGPNIPFAGFLTVE